ncbi:SapC family protein [Yoonia sp.]|uniref:SapC family protein n=1 Tax=Yoonia sp. TaxID=2212373 RepID=UPI00358E54EC
MAKQLMIYERAVPISAQTHRDWSVKTGNNFSFAKDINSVPLLAAEFATAALEHTIIFAGEGDAVFPSVILGMQGNNNDHVNADGTWKGRYVPAFLRRYPFVFSKSDDGETFTLCIDEEFEGFNNDGKGERLFDNEGGRTQYLETMLKFIQEYQNQFTRTQMFTKKLHELDLLAPAQAEFKLAGKQSALAGFQTINREKLKALTGKQLKDLAATDELELCYLHLQSLNNLTPMARRLAEKSAA